MKRTCSVVALAVLAAASMAAPAGSEFVGAWVNVQRAKDTVIIDRDGGTFVFRETSPSIFDGKMHTASYPASMKDGKLTVMVAGFPVTFTVEKTSGNLATADGRRYTHQH